jgi:hypothetical protein
MNALRKLFFGGLLVAARLGGFTGIAHAEPPPRVLLELPDAADAEHEKEPLRAALQKELPKSVTVTVRVAASPGGAPGERPGPTGEARLIVTRLPETGGVARLRVRYEAADGKVIERAIDVPEDPEKRREIIALLLANWVQDEADDLADSLRPPPPPVVEPPPAESGAAVALPDPKPAPPAPAEEDPVAEACLSSERKRMVDYPVLFEAFPLGRDKAAAFPGAARDPDGRVAFSLSLVGSHRGGVRGGAVSALGSYGRRSVCGLDFAGLGSQVAGPVVGAQIVGFIGLARDLYGVQLAPVGFVERSVVGAQSGVVAVAGRVRGGQLASVNAATTVRGLQLGAVNLAFERGDLQLGAVNLAGRSFLQLGAFNLARQGDVQLGAVNVAGQSRLQLFGVNVADRATVQVGVVNIADRSDVPIGLLNFVRHGRTHLDFLAYDYRGAAVELVHGGRYTHAVYGVGARRSSAGDYLPVFYAGIGGHIPLATATDGHVSSLDVDVLSHFLPGPSFRQNTQLQQLRVAVAVPVVTGISLFAGPTLNVSLTDASDRLGPVSAFGASVTDTGTTTTVRLWPGVAAGLRLF